MTSVISKYISSWQGLPPPQNVLKSPCHGFFLPFFFLKIKLIFKRHIMEMWSLSTRKLPCELQLVLLRSFKKWRLCEGLRSIRCREKVCTMPLKNPCFPPLYLDYLVNLREHIMQMKTIDTVLRCDCLTEAILTVIDKVPRAWFDIVGWFYPLARPQISHSPLEVFGASQVRSSKFWQQWQRSFHQISLKTKVILQSCYPSFWHSLSSRRALLVQEANT